MPPPAPEITSGLAQHRRALEEQFKTRVAKDSIAITLEPGVKVKVRLSFTPPDERTHSTVLLVRNNLTVLDAMLVQGRGGRGFLKFGNRKPGSALPLAFNIGAKHLKDCDSGRGSRYYQPNFTVKRSFVARNTGELPVTVWGFRVNEAACEGYGFKVLDCRGFQLAPNTSHRVDIAFTPDFTLAKVQQRLVIHTSLAEGQGQAGPAGTVEYALVATVPAQLLAECGAAVPRPGWEAPLYYAVVLAMVAMLAGAVVLAVLEADHILKTTVVAMTTAVPANGHVPPFDKSRVFDLRAIGQAETRGAPAGLRNGYANGHAVPDRPRKVPATTTEAVANGRKPGPATRKASHGQATAPAATATATSSATSTKVRCPRQADAKAGGGDGGPPPSPSDYSATSNQTKNTNKTKGNNFINNNNNNNNNNNTSNINNNSSSSSSKGTNKHQESLSWARFFQRAVGKAEAAGAAEAREAGRRCPGQGQAPAKEDSNIGTAAAVQRQSVATETDLQLVEAFQRVRRRPRPSTATPTTTPTTPTTPAAPAGPPHHQEEETSSTTTESSNTDDLSLSEAAGGRVADAVAPSQASSSSSSSSNSSTSSGNSSSSSSSSSSSGRAAKKRNAKTKSPAAKPTSSRGSALALGMAAAAVAVTQHEDTSNSNVGSSEAASKAAKGGRKGRGEAFIPEAMELSYTLKAMRPLEATRDKDHHHHHHHHHHQQQQQQQHQQQQQQQQQQHQHHHHQHQQHHHQQHHQQHHQSSSSPSPAWEDPRHSPRQQDAPGTSPKGGVSQPQPMAPRESSYSAILLGTDKAAGRSRHAAAMAKPGTETNRADKPLGVIGQKTPSPLGGGGGGLGALRGISGPAVTVAAAATMATVLPAADHHAAPAFASHALKDDYGRSLYSGGHVEPLHSWDPKTLSAPPVLRPPPGLPQQAHDPPHRHPAMQGDEDWSRYEHIPVGGGLWPEGGAAAAAAAGGAGYHTHHLPHHHGHHHHPAEPASPAPAPSLWDSLSNIWSPPFWGSDQGQAPQPPPMAAAPQQQQQQQPSPWNSSLQQGVAAGNDASGAVSKGLGFDPFHSVGNIWSTPATHPADLWPPPSTKKDV